MTSITTKHVLVTTFLLLLSLTSITASDDKLHYHMYFSKIELSSNIISILPELINRLTQKTQGNFELHIHFSETLNDSLKEPTPQETEIADMVQKIKTDVEKIKEDVNRSVESALPNLTNKITANELETGVKELKAGFNASQQNIEVAVQKTQDAFSQVKQQIRTIQLPTLILPRLVAPVISLSRIAIRMIPCAITLNKAIPSLLEFVKAVSINNAAEAVLQLFGVLKYMPDISQKCAGQCFNIPPNKMNKSQCAADIVGLTAIFGQFILAPEQVIMTASNLHTLVDLVPRTIADCTGAFNSQTSYSEAAAM